MAIIKDPADEILNLLENIKRCQTLDGVDVVFTVLASSVNFLIDTEETYGTRTSLKYINEILDEIIKQFIRDPEGFEGMMRLRRRLLDN